MGRLSGPMSGLMTIALHLVVVLADCPVLEAMLG
jgi:hypothetical protein